MQGSQAYARALAKAGVLTEEESSKIQEGLGKVGKEWEADSFEVGVASSLPLFPCRYDTSLAHAEGSLHQTGLLEDCSSSCWAAQVLCGPPDNLLPRQSS